MSHGRNLAIFTPKQRLWRDSLFPRRLGSGSLGVADSALRNLTNRYTEDLLMKVVVIIVLLAIAGVCLLVYSGSSIEESFDPTQQGKDARAAISDCATWTEVIDKIGEPSFWREGASDFDFLYKTRYEAGARDEIAGMMENGDLQFGFSFLYKYSASATFAVNFDRNGKKLNIQDKMSAKDLMGTDDE